MTNPIKLPTKGPLSAHVAEHVRDYFSANQNEKPTSGLYDRVLHEVERPLLEMTLAECRGNQIKAAAALGLNRNTLRKKLRLLGIAAVRQKKTR